MRYFIASCRRLRLLSLISAAFRHYFIIDSMPFSPPAHFHYSPFHFRHYFRYYAIFIIAFRFSLFTLSFISSYYLAAFTMLPPLAPEAIRER
jgi:hypothetical protein